MVDSTLEVPVHDALQIVDATDVYRHEEWWKAVVTYQFEGSDTVETAVYLWHDDDGWTRKHKYAIKTPSAWSTDSQIISAYVHEETHDSTATDSFPVSDYYTVATGETVFQENGWWKAIVCISEKGSYETDEVMVYVWQKRDGDWRRRQKYVIKSLSDWEEEKSLIDEHLEYHDGEYDSSTTESVEATDGVSGDLQQLGDELGAHLSDEFQ